MAKPLVIVESPAKAKTIAKFLGDAYDIRASVGHVADLPSKGLSIDVDNGFKPTYELTVRGKDVVKDLRAAMKGASELYLATDEDREGEAISWHLLEYLQPKIPVKRMVFHEITKAAIDHAVANPRDIDYGLVDAAETRRLLDRLYGYEVSPVLWRRVNRGLWHIIYFSDQYVAFYQNFRRISLASCHAVFHLRNFGRGFYNVVYRLRFQSQR